jgi:hypothetical protein
MLVLISLSAGVLNFNVSVLQNVVYEYTPVEFVIVTSCKQMTDSDPTSTFAESVLISNTGCVPVVFVVMRAM